MDGELPKPTCEMQNQNEEILKTAKPRGELKLADQNAFGIHLQILERSAKQGKKDYHLTSVFVR